MPHAPADVRVCCVCTDHSSSSFHNAFEVLFSASLLTCRLVRIDVYSFECLFGGKGTADRNACVPTTACSFVLSCNVSSAVVLALYVEGGVKLPRTRGLVLLLLVPCNGVPDYIPARVCLSVLHVINCVHSGPSIFDYHSR